MLAVAGPALAEGVRHGRHGARIVALVLLVAVVVGIILWVRHRHRRASTPATTASELPGDEVQQLQRPSPVTGTRWTHLRRVPANTIHVRGLTKRYGDKLAVDDLGFDVEPGHVTGFLGPNGAGKSTTMRMIMGLDTPDAGTASVNGRSYHDLQLPLREVGALLEATAIHPGRSARAHLWMMARTNLIPRQRVDEVLGIVGLSGVADQRVGQFSLGMRQRLGIAVALLGDPGILMFDEPVNGLDTDGIRWVRTLLRSLASEGRAIFVSSHLMAEMAVTADQVVVIGKGRLIAEMPIDEFTARNSNAFVRVRSPERDALRTVLEHAGATVDVETDNALAVRGLSREHIGEAAWNNSILLHELASQSPSLEEAFVGSTERTVEFSASTSSGTEEPAGK